MEQTDAQRWNFLAFAYPIVFTLGAIGVLRLGVAAAAAAVVCGTLLVWLKQPISVSCRQSTVVFRVLPLWVRGIEVPADSLAVAVRRGAVRFRPRDGRRLPVFRTLSWHRDLIDPGLPTVLAALRSAGCQVDTE